MIKRYIEFFQGDNGLLSMTRLLIFLSIFPASYVVIDTANESTLGWFLSAYVFGYLGGKGADVTANILNKPTKPATIIQNAESVTTKTETGDINVSGS